MPKPVSPSSVSYPQFLPVPLPFALPAILAPALRARFNRQSLPLPSSVVLVDDDPNAAFFTRRALRKAAPEASFTFFEDARAALAHMQDQLDNHPEGLPDLLLLDLNMPALSGWEFLDQACEPEKLRKTRMKLYILTSSVNPDDIERARRSECVDGYLEKHLTADKLREIFES